MTRARPKRSLKERRRRARTILGGLAAFVLVGLFVGVVVLLNRSELLISTIRVSEMVYTREDLVQHTVSGMLSGRYLGVVPRANALLYPREAIEQSLEEVFPAIRDVTLRRAGFTELNVIVTERTPDARWCSDAASTSRCFLLDESGLVFARAEGGAVPPLQFFGLLGEHPLGEVYAPEFYTKLRALVENLELATGREVLSVRLDEVNDVFVALSGGGELRFTTKNLGPELTDAVASVFASRRFEAGDVLEYADFRFGNKIFVKFEGE